MVIRAVGTIYHIQSPGAALDGKLCREEIHATPLDRATDYSREEQLCHPRVAAMLANRRDLISYDRRG